MKNTPYCREKEEDSATICDIGPEQTLLSSIKNLMESLNLTMEQAMSALKLDEADCVKYKEILERV